MNKKDLSERDICTKFITPAVSQAGWDLLSQAREEESIGRHCQIANAINLVSDATGVDAALTNRVAAKEKRYVIRRVTNPRLCCQPDAPSTRARSFHRHSQSIAPCHACTPIACCRETNAVRRNGPALQ